MIKSFLVFLVLSLSANAYAETFILKDNSKVKGTILDFHEDKFVISLYAGGKQIVHKKNIAQIVFQAKQSETTRKGETTPSQTQKPQFASPIKTFLHWKNAAIKRDIHKMAECFITPSREDQLVQLKSFSKKKMKQMSKATKKTEFTLGEPLYDGDKAYLSVTRKRGKAQTTSIIEFQKEGSNWKMLPE